MKATIEMEECIKASVWNRRNYKDLGDWTRRESNTQPSDLESDALPLRHGSLCMRKGWSLFSGNLVVHYLHLLQTIFCSMPWEWKHTTWSSQLTVASNKWMNVVAASSTSNSVKKLKMEMRDIEPRTPRMQSERSTMWAISPIIYVDFGLDKRFLVP
jgi:hypothetical protein